MPEAGARMRERAGGGRPGELSRHALGTPLLAIRGAAELLLSGAVGPLGAEARELVGAAGEAAGRLERLLGPLLEVAGWAGAPPPRLRPLDLRPLLQDAGVRLRGPPAAVRAGGGNFRGLKIDLAKLGGPAMARADPLPLAAGLGLARRLLGDPLEARLAPGRRRRLLLLELRAADGRPAAGATAEEAGLLLGLLGRLVRRAGGRLVPLAPGRLGIVLRAAQGCGARVTA